MASMRTGRRRHAAPDFLSWTEMDETLNTLGETIAKGLGASLTGHAVSRGELTISVKAEDIIKVAKFLRDDLSCLFKCIIDITAVDWPGREKRFDVIYHFLSPRLN